jgi:hypothetical protein
VLVAFTSLTAVPAVRRTTWGGGRGVFAQLIQFNSCSGIFLSAVDGVFVAHGMSSATMEAAIPLTDIDGPVGTLVVDVEVTAHGPLLKTRSRSRTEFETEEGDVIVTFSRFTGKTREADASGTLVFDGAELSGTFSDALIDDSKSGDMVIQHSRHVSPIVTFRWG